MPFTQVPEVEPKPTPTSKVKPKALRKLCAQKDVKPSEVQTITDPCLLLKVTKKKVVCFFDYCDTTFDVNQKDEITKHFRDAHKYNLKGQVMAYCNICHPGQGSRTLENSLTLKEIKNLMVTYHGVLRAGGPNRRKTKRSTPDDSELDTSDTNLWLSHVVLESYYHKYLATDQTAYIQPHLAISINAENHHYFYSNFNLSLLTKEKLIWPIHWNGNHWMVLAIDQARKISYFIDPANQNLSRQQQDHHKRILGIINNFLSFKNHEEKIKIASPQPHPT